MAKYIALMISTLPLLSSVASANEVSDMCNSNRYDCQKVRSNYMIIYPKKNIDNDHYQVNRVNDPRESPYKSSTNRENLIDIDLINLTWSAFNDAGEFMRSGHVSGGKDYCPDIERKCNTITGTFIIYHKGDESCKSSLFPIGRGGAPMPYCMYFHGGYALHGSNFVPDYNASHGCIRMSPEDAKWLNEKFVKVGSTRVDIHH